MRLTSMRPVWLGLVMLTLVACNTSNNDDEEQCVDKSEDLKQDIPDLSHEKYTQLVPLAWVSDDGNVRRVSDGAYDVTIHDGSVTTKLEAFLKRRGLRQLFDEVMNKPYRTDQSSDVKLKGYQWTMERGESEASNLHTLHPTDTASFTQILSTLAHGGFNRAMPEFRASFPHLDSLTIYQASFSVHSSTSSQDLTRYIQSDKLFTLIIPIRIGSSAEFLIEGLDYKQRQSIGLLIQDGTHFALAACKDKPRISLILRIGQITSTDPENEFQVKPHWSIHGESALLSFLKPELEVGELEWLSENWGPHSRGRLASQIYEVGVTPGLAETIKAFFFRTFGLEFSLDPGETKDLVVRGAFDWKLERTPIDTCDTHTLSPSSVKSYNEFLSILQKGGLDEVLTGIGLNFQHLESLTIFSASLSVQSEVSSHEDMKFYSSDNKIFTFILPVLSYGKSPELAFNLISPKSRPNHAFIIGDGAAFGSAECEQESRLSVVLRVGEISEDYVDNRLRMKPHWSRTDPTVSLPTYKPGDFLDIGVESSQIEPFRWKGSGEIAVNHLYLTGLTPELTDTLVEYCKHTGITETFRKLLIQGETLEAGAEYETQYEGKNWYVHRPKAYWHSNMHWISPLDKESHGEYLQALSRGGFDKVLQAIGTKFDLEGLVAYHVSFIGISESEKNSYFHSDVATGVRGFNIIVPLVLASASDCELEVAALDELTGSYKYTSGQAIMIGDGAEYRTAALGYNGEMLMAATIYVADIQKDNIAQLLKDYTHRFPPKDDSAFFLDQAGTHWRRDDTTAMLPREASADSA